MSITLYTSGTICLLFLSGFWLTPWGICDLKRRANGEMQLDLRAHYTPEQAESLLTLYGPAGIARFRCMLWIDMIFPVAFATFFSSIALVAQRHFEGTYGWATLALVVCSVAAALCDYAENVLLLDVLKRWPQRAPAKIRQASRFATGKFSFTMASVFALAVCALAWCAFDEALRKR